MDIPRGHSMVSEFVLGKREGMLKAEHEQHQLQCHGRWTLWLLCLWMAVHTAVAAAEDCGQQPTTVIQFYGLTH